MNNTSVVYLACLLAALTVVIRVCLSSAHKWKFSDLVYLGHVFVLSVVFFLLYTGTYLLLLHRQPESAFNKQRWQTAPEERAAMVNDLVNGGSLRDKTPGEIKNMLGLPMRVYKDSAGYRWGYYAGIRNSPFHIDPDFLVLQISEEKVKGYYIKPGVPYIQ